MVRSKQGRQRGSCPHAWSSDLDMQCYVSHIRSEDDKTSSSRDGDGMHVMSSRQEQAFDAMTLCTEPYYMFLSDVPRFFQSEGHLGQTFRVG